MVRKMVVVMAMMALTLILSAGLYAQEKGKGHAGRGSDGNQDRQRMKDYAQQQGITPEKWQNMTQDEREQFKQQMQQQMQQQGGGNGCCPQGGNGDWKAKVDSVAQQNGFKNADDMKSQMQNMSDDQRQQLYDKIKGQMGQNGDHPQGDNGERNSPMDDFARKNGFKDADDMKTQWQNMSDDQRQQLMDKKHQYFGDKDKDGDRGDKGSGDAQYKQQWQQIKSQEDALKDQMKKVMLQEEQLENQWKNMSPDEREQNKSQMEAQHQQIESQRQAIMQQYRQLEIQKHQLKANCEKCQKDKPKQTNKGESQNQGGNKNSGNNGGGSPKTTNEQENEITPDDIMDK